MDTSPNLPKTFFRFTALCLFFSFYSFLICQQVRQRCSGQTVKPQEELLFKRIKEAKRTVGPAAPPENCRFPLFILICWKLSLFASFHGVKRERLEQSQNYSCSLRVLILRHSIQSQHTLEKEKKIQNDTVSIKSFHNWYYTIIRKVEQEAARSLDFSLRTRLRVELGVFSAQKSNVYT